MTEIAGDEHYSWDDRLTTAEELIEEANGWLGEMIAEMNSVDDKEPPTPEEVEQWVCGWMDRAEAWMKEGR